MGVWTVQAGYDPEASVWYTVDADMPGLLADGETLEVLAAKLGPMLLDLLEFNADQIDDKAKLQAPHRFHIVAHAERDFDVAA
ncbi:DUF1902 domain-containing protein [uncultured Sphingomonas sp.]|uniref:DUF1902 domain-containing protein n=1 Tax=uncultured Sphingomonas sp. TaxID=158754 RepID=UPI002627C8C1|nr:DUF1902 domain-containing protein [uncultured Sphingomonas sp.]